MARLPDAQKLIDRIDLAISRLSDCRAIVPTFCAAARHERDHPTGRLPTAAMCDKRSCSGEPHGVWDVYHGVGFVDDPERPLPPPYHQDPTGEAVVNAHPTRASFDVERLTYFVKALDELDEQGYALLNQFPAAATAIRTGFPPTNGQTAEQADADRKGATEAESACLACQLGVSEVGPLARGYCGACRFLESAAGMPERFPSIAEQELWQREHHEHEWRHNEAEVFDLRDRWPPLPEETAA